MLTHDKIMNELIRWLDEKKATGKQIAELLRLPPPRITEMRQGKRRLQQHEMPVIANFLGMEGEIEVPVVGFVGAGGEVVFEDAYEKGGALYEAAALPGMDTSNLIGLEVRGDSMYPAIRDGHVAFFRRDGWDHVEDDALREWSVCRLKDGRTLLKEVRRSAEPDRYDLISTNAPPIEAVELEWATPIVGWRRR